MKPSLGLICIALLISPFVFGSVSSSSSPLKHPLLGIAPEDEKYYKTSSDWIKCKDGSKKFSKTQLNDDFCDCPDGTDEPGTSACPLGKFYCRNSGHAPLFLYSSRVNDGICDCCDGSDEYDGKVKCPNTCWEAGKVARDKLKKKIATYQEGVTLRKQNVEQAKLSLAKDEAELLKLKDEEKILKVLVEQLKERKDEIEKAEEKERLRKEIEEKERKEAEEKANQEKRKTEQEANQGTSEAEEKTNNEEKPIESMHVDDIGTLEDSSADQDVATDNDESEAEVEYSDDSGNEGSHVDGVEQHAAEAKEESAVIPETVHDSESKGNDASENTEGLSKEELGRLVASRWTGENTEKQTEEVDAAKDKDHGGHEEIPEATHDEEDDGYASETDDDNQRYEDEDMEDEVDEDFREEDHYDSGSYKSESDTEPDLSDITTPSNPSWLEKIQKTVHNILRAVNLFQTSVNQTEAASVRKEYDDSSAKLSKLQSRISSLSEKLKHDFGPEKEFYSFYDRCFESKQNKYVYKVCPYKQASQEESHTTTRLGWLHLLEWSTNKWNHSNAYRPPYLVGLLSVESWPVVGATFGNIQGYGRWDKFEDSYRVMTFSNGDKCWNGPDRSLKVRLRCGLKNEVADVDEPSRCEYVALLYTPALCLEEKLKELQHKLELMNKEQPQSHDEL